MPPHAAVAAALDAVEAELRAAGFWQDEPLSPEAMNFREAFATDTMAFPQWLQFVFVPNVRHLVETEGDLPPASQVAAQAVRELDGVVEARALLDRLAEFDALFG